MSGYIAGYIARALSPEERKDFQAQTLSLMGEIAKVKQRNARIGLIVGAIGTVFGLSGAWAWGHLLPYLHVRDVNHYIIADTVHGFIAEETDITNVPKDFTQANDEHWIKQYVSGWYNYDFHTTAKNYEFVQLLSSDDEKERYRKWYADPLSPAQKFMKSCQNHVTGCGFVDVDDKRWVITKTADDGTTRQYTVHFAVTETVGGQPGPMKYWTGDIAFQWLPKLATNEAYRRDNPGGFTTVTFHATED